MNTLLEDARSLLEKAGYLTHAIRPDEPVFYFEDDCLLGFLKVFESTEQLSSQWRSEQDGFLRLNATRLGQDPIKAWNLYAIFLTRALASEDTARALFEIEEDFQSTRKVARGGIRTKDELAVVLGPLLPIQTTLSLVPTNVQARLLERLGPEGSPRRLLASDARPEEIARLLLEEA